MGNVIVTTPEELKEIVSEAIAKHLAPITGRCYTVTRQMFYLAGYYKPNLTKSQKYYSL